MKNNCIKIKTIFDLMKNGEKRGFELLYNLYYNKMYGAAFLVIKDEDRTVDIIHNVMYKLLNLDKSKFPVDNELTWLYRVVKNEALMVIRKEKRIVSLADIGELQFEDRQIEDYISMNSYYSMIKPLNEEQRNIVTLKVLGGYSHKEIAKILGKPIGTIQWKYNMAIKKLRVVLNSYMAIIIGLIAGVVYRLIWFIKQRNPIMPPNVSVDTIIPKYDILLIVLSILLIILICSFIIFLKKSDKIPTKCHSKTSK